MIEYYIILDCWNKSCSVSYKFSRHLEKLREMHGLEVLHSVIQETNFR